MAIDSILFLGFPMDDSFGAALKKNKPEYLSLFIHPEEDHYLKEVCFQEIHYLGKYVNNEEPLHQLELLEANIFSLLKKLVSEYDYTKSNLVLFALPQKTSTLSNPSELKQGK